MGDDVIQVRIMEQDKLSREILLRFWGKWIRVLRISGEKCVDECEWLIRVQTTIYYILHTSVYLLNCT